MSKQNQNNQNQIPESGVKSKAFLENTTTSELPKIVQFSGNP